MNAILGLFFCFAAAAASNLHYGKGPVHGHSSYGSYSKQTYHGVYPGKCGNDGFYYNDGGSFVMCSNGNAYVQPCAPGSRNSGSNKYTYGQTYYYHDFCDVNLVDYGYGIKHGYGYGHNVGYHGGYGGGYGYGHNAGYGHPGGYGGHPGGYGQPHGYGVHNAGYGHSHGYAHQGYGHNVHGGYHGGYGAPHGNSYGQKKVSYTKKEYGFASHGKGKH